MAEPHPHLHGYFKCGSVISHLCLLSQAQISRLSWVIYLFLVSLLGEHISSLI